VDDLDVRTVRQPICDVETRVDCVSRIRWNISIDPPLDTLDIHLTGDVDTGST